MNNHFEGVIMQHKEIIQWIESEDLQRGEDIHLYYNEIYIREWAMN